MQIRGWIYYSFPLFNFIHYFMLRDSSYIGDRVSEKMNITGGQKRHVKRLVRAYMERMGYCMEYGISYRSKYIYIGIYESSIRRRLKKSKYWCKLFQEFVYRFEHDMGVYNKYLLMMRKGFKFATSINDKLTLMNKKKKRFIKN